MALLTLLQLHINFIIIPVLQDDGKLNNKTEAQEAELSASLCLFSSPTYLLFKAILIINPYNSMQT
jgi:hypothetical protein